MRIRILMGVFAVAAVSLSAHAEPIDDLAAKYLPWVANQTGYSAKYVEPNIYFVTQERLNEAYYKGQFKQDISKNVTAMSFGDIIMLRKDFKIGKDDDTLVHELTHVLQHANRAKFPCRNLMELEAYKTADEFVTKKGIGTKTAEYLLHFFSTCPPPYEPQW